MKTKNDPVTESAAYAVLSVRQIRALLTLARKESVKNRGRVHPASTIVLRMPIEQTASVRSLDGAVQISDIFVDGQNINRTAFAKHAA